ncbi:adenylyl-sulfate kinase [Kibdelosporangium aridum]|uniref:Adenylyl-sulfate kinase n=1 Tax=Kibdelosporangium aridum TaxID=2030 RepID=A0A1Y5X2N9_KIBAR|nr:adenylyl-sulfate kinase [Kibdelosporangium aridum]SMC66714.1 bifunctional enzyme CysN/CysC [Kibdelosporangium aridum]
MVSVLRVIACGSVDDGKSTLIGRLLAKTGGATDDELDYATRTRRGGSTIPAGEVDYSLLTDGLEAEHEQGITIDVAYRFLDLPSGRRVIIADAPGHEQYTRNMAVAASTADLAVLLIDATKGVREQTHRHLAICALMGVRAVIAVVNKLDGVGYDRAVFDKLANEVQEAASGLDVAASVIPASALSGDNVVEPSPNLPWYDGPTLLDALANWQPTGELDRAEDYRLPVQYVIRADDFRGFAGTVVGSSVRPGDAVAVAGSSVTSKIDRVLGPGGVELDRADPGTPVTLTLSHDVDVRRGDLLTTPETLGNGLAPATACSATLVWTAEEPLRHGRSYLLLAGSRTVPAVVTSVRGRLEVLSGKQLAARTLGLNDIGTVELTTDTPICLDSYQACRDTGSFLLVDRVTKETVAAGMVRYALRRGRNIVPHAYTVDRETRQQLKGQRAKVLWLTGLPGAGKSTIADALERKLHAMGLHTYVLDGDNVRSGLNKDLGFTPEARAENVRRVAEVSRILLDAGLIVIVALVSPFRTDRAVAKGLFQPGDFAEVWVNTPADVCASRDPKGLYAKAKAGTLPNMTGMGQAYEPPEHPDLVVDGAGSLDDVTDELCTLVGGV